MARVFKSANYEQPMLLPPTIDEWLPNDHLARFIVNIIEQLNLSELYNSYGQRGSIPYDPKLILGLIFYGYCIGVFSSRKIERATFDSVAFRYISGDHHPDHDTINSFRKRFLPQIEDLFKQILTIATEAGVLKIGNVSFDGTKVNANASKHKAMSYGHASKLEQKIKEEVELLLKKAQEENEKDEDSGLNIPAEIARREDQIAKIQEAKRVIEERAKERYQQEKEEYDRKAQQRKLNEEKTGKKTPGRVPQEPKETPEDKDQYNFTDPVSRIMKTGGGFDQCYNAQAGVDHDSRLIVGQSLSNSPNDQKELVKTVDSIPDEIGTPENGCADAGYLSETNIDALIERGIDPYIAAGRDHHHSYLENKLNNTEADNTVDKSLSKIEEMRRKLISEEGKEIYRHRKMTVEPVFGIIKQAMGFRRFSFRGQEKVSKEWGLVCLAYNLRRLFNLNLAV
jgi:transposase